MSVDFDKIKKNRMQIIRGQETKEQIKFIDAAGADLVTAGVLIPGDVIPNSTDTSAAGVFVGAGSVLRIQIQGADTYVAFGDDTIGAVDVNTTPAIKLSAGYYLVSATDDYIRTSSNPLRLEVWPNSGNEF